MPAIEPTPPAAGLDGSPREHRSGRRWLRWLIVVGAVLVILLGSGIAAWSFFYARVTLPDQITLPQRTTVY
jgi:hypothetical protein